MRKIIAFCLSFIILIIPSGASALTAAQWQTLYGSTEYYTGESSTGESGSSTTSPTCDNPALESSEGSGPLMGPGFPAVTNTEDLVNSINTYIANTEPSSPFINLGAEFVAAGEKYDVNPAMVVAIGQKEENLGTDNQPAVNINDDSFGVTGITIGSYTYPVEDGFVVFPSFEASIDPVTEYIYEQYLAPNSPDYSTTVQQVMYNGYTPGSDRDAAVAATLDVMQQILQGISAQPGVEPAPNSPVVNSCTGQTTPVTSAGAYGWDLSGSNAMITYNMEDPQWRDLPYPSIPPLPAGVIGVDGCGPTSIAMVVATLTGNNSVTPATIASQYGSLYHGSDGTDWSIFQPVATDYHLTMVDLGTNLNTPGSPSAEQILDEGGLVIISVNPGFFTTEGHFMVIRAVTPNGGSFYLNDPNSGPLGGDDWPAGSTNGDNNYAFPASFLQTTGAMAQLWGFTK
ncbi:MAG TPA: C39 family peptidase [Candidatus Binatia bacterium]|nr:C39 family peptidase [Candidatus Binatia bacterium]